MERWTNIFSKLSVEIVKENHFEIVCGNRKYVYDNSLLPSKIEINGENVLSTPVALNMNFTEPHSGLVDVYFKITEKTEERVVVIGSATCGNVVINETIIAEPDGFVKTDLKFSSFWSFSANGMKTPKLNKMNITVDVKEKYSPLFHYWPNDRQSILPAPDVVNSGETQEFEFMFKPYVWTGNNREGLGLYFGETAEPFQLDDGDKCITVSKNGDTKITLNMLDSMPYNWQGRDDHWCETLKPLHFTIGFQATPVEKKNTLVYDEYYKRMHIKNKEFYGDENINAYAKKGVKWIIVHEDWSAIQNFGMPYDEEKFKKTVEKYHKKGIKVMVYFGYEYSTLTPDFTENCNDYLIKTINDNFTGGWQRKPAQRAFMACYKGGYAKVMRERVAYVMDELGVDGIYTDGTYVPWECANKAHGCGYTDKDGIRHTTFPFMAVRNHVKELFKIVHERGGIIDTHNSSCCIMPLYAFADSCYDGENIQGCVKKGGIEFLSLAGFRAEFMGINYGFIPNFIAYVTSKEELEALYALTLIHNVHARPSTFSGADKDGEMILGYVSSIWKMFDQYGLDKKEWIPYFENSEVTTENAYVSLYKDKKETIAVISKFAKNNEQVELVSENYKKATDILNNKEYKFTGNKALIDVAPDKPHFFVFK